MKIMFLTVVTASRSGAIGSGLTYEAGTQKIQPGSAVRVPLRKSFVEGIVIEVMDKKLQTEFDLRSIKEVLGDVPLLTEAQIKTVRWMSEYYCCSLRQALQVWLPPPPWSRLLPKETVMFRKAANDRPARGKKAEAVLEFLEGREWTSREEIIHETGASPAVLKRLLELGCLVRETQRASMLTSRPVSVAAKNEAVLTSSQKEVYESVKTDPRPSLLFGITSSGKTEIYAALIADAIRAGKQAILLVPEILLTENVIDRFTQMLAHEQISVLHSRLKPGQRKEEWKRIHRGDVSLVIGSRSALFAPLKNLGIVILDEEHEWTYKNEQTPRYHARETAEALCRHAGAKLLLGSATPSLESWSRAQRGSSTRAPYHLARLPDRYGSNALATVTVVDLAGAEFGKNYPFTSQLLTAIEERLKRKEQTVLFLNRRGAASALLCLECRRRVISTESQLPFTVHHDSSGKPFLIDHTTNIRADVPAKCPHCASVNLIEVGAGTQRIEAIMTKLFPKARLLRADTDTLETPEQMRSLLQKMKNGEADILLGTQSVVKGLDLPNVTLAAVMIADIGLSLPHFRAGERIMQLLTQLTGRSGRAKPGEVIIQTFRPDSAEVIAASKHETERYLEDELRMRLHAGYPPAASMIRLLVRGPDAGARAKKLQTDAMTANMKSGGNVKISMGPTLFGAGREWQVLLRGEKPRELLAHLHLKDVPVDVDQLETV
ncbi:MAG: primosomal protein N' [Candidatus Peribacteraceae bacterium]|nr:primosomal protein N' [Candidatus Peribacteraceae bacterium]